MNNIKEAFDTLANIAGGIIKDDKFEKLESTKVIKKELNHEPEKFYCLTVPGSSFVIKSDGKVSITGNCHSNAGAWLFRTVLNEAKNNNEISQEEIVELQQELEDTAKVILEHESVIINKIFERGTIKGITDVQLKHFVESRLDLCLSNLGYKHIFNPSYNPIASWFYNDINSSTLHDFFSSTGNDYNRNWNEKGFVW